MQKLQVSLHFEGLVKSLVGKHLRIYSRWRSDDVDGSQGTTGVGFADVAGIDDVVKELQEVRYRENITSPVCCRSVALGFISTLDWSAILLPCFF